jgi:hypothetical protein
MKIRHQNLWDTVKTILKEKFITLNANIRKDGGPRINNLSYVLGKLEKE